MNPLGLDYLDHYGTHPVDFIRIAAASGCAHVSVFVKPLTFPGFTDHPPLFQNDPQLRRDTVACLRDTGVTIALMDGFTVVKDLSVERYWPAFDILGELGVTQISTTAPNETLGKSIDQIGLLAEKARAYGVTVVIEPVPIFTIKSLPMALDVIAQLKMTNLKLVVDTMHTTYSGDVDRLPEVDPELIDYVQLCDGPLPAPSAENYVSIAGHNRMIPGEGDLPLVEMLSYLRPEVIVSTEIPLQKLRSAGVSGVERARRSAEGARKVMHAADEKRRARGA